MTARQVAESGLGLDDITEILRAHVGVTAEALHTDPTHTSLDQFRQSIADAMSQPDTYLIANFDRYEFMGEGGGHHSPLGAFCAASDTVLVLDVARYRSVSLSANHACAGSQLDCMHTLSTDSRELAEHRMFQAIAGHCVVYASMLARRHVATKAASSRSCRLYYVHIFVPCMHVMCCSMIHAGQPSEGTCNPCCHRAYNTFVCFCTKSTLCGVQV